MTIHGSHIRSPHVARSPVSTARVALSVILGVRACINAVFASWLWFAEPGRASFFAGAAAYLAVDGIFALAAATLLAFDTLGEAPRALTGATAADGLLRTTAAMALSAFPGLSDFPVTAVILFGIVGSCAACLAITGITIPVSAWLSRRRAHRSEPLAVHEELDPISLAGVVALALVAYAFFAGPPTTAAEYRALGIRWASALAVAFTIAVRGVTSK